MHGYLLWEASGGQVSILVRRDILDELKEVAQEEFSESDEEAGGVLMGRSEKLVEAGRRVITIENFQTGMSALHSRSFAGSVVGFVRFRRQRTLHLKDTDFLTLRAGLELVCLMVRPDEKKGAVGGFFFRDGKTIRCPVASLQFPIDSAAKDCSESAAAAEESPEPVDEPGGGTRRLLYAAIGFALMCSSLAIWLVGR